jgi:hypothetical protein
MREQVFDPENIWRVESSRTGEVWYVKCPSRSGAKIFVCSPQGPGVSTDKGPFYTEPATPDTVPEGQLLQAWFYSANDPRNWA